MQATLTELAELVDGRLVGNGELVIRGAAPLGDAEPGQITHDRRGQEKGRVCDGLSGGGRRSLQRPSWTKTCR